MTLAEDEAAEVLQEPGVNVRLDLTTLWACGECSKSGSYPLLAAIGVYEGNTYTCPKCDRQFIVRLVE